MSRADYQDRLHRLEAQARDLTSSGRYEDSGSIELAFRVRGHNRLYFDPVLRQALDELCAKAWKRRARAMDPRHVEEPEPT